MGRTIFKAKFKPLSFRNPRWFIGKVFSKTKITKNLPRISQLKKIKFKNK